MTDAIFLQPVFKERIWGGERLKEVFNYDIPSSETGECWGISAHPNGPCTVINGDYKGQTLEALWTNHPELFDHYKSKTFPLLTKILDAKTDLSVQVHPNDQQAQEMEGEPFGKTECWYVIDAEPGAEIVYGHHAKSAEEFSENVQDGKWDALLRTVPVKAGDFFYVPSGTIHAIGGGILILETQQSSDVTYRVYDYDRTDAKGNTRDLHIDQSIAVTRFPHVDPELEQTTQTIQGAKVTKRVSETNFTVYDVHLNGAFSADQTKPFILVSVLDGEGNVEVKSTKTGFKKGDHFILPASIGHFKVNGNAHLIVSHV